MHLRKIGFIFVNHLNKDKMSSVNKYMFYSNNVKSI